jgi:hypothetical protein
MPHRIRKCTDTLYDYAIIHNNNNNNNNHKHPGLGHLARSVSRVTLVLSIVSSVYQLLSFLVGCNGMILKVFGFVAFFADVRVSAIINC